MSTASHEQTGSFSSVITNPIKFADVVLGRKKSRIAALEQGFDLKWSTAHAGARPSASSPMSRDQFRKISPDAKNRPRRNAPLNYHCECDNRREQNPTDATRACENIFSRDDRKQTSVVASSMNGS